MLKYTVHPIPLESELDKAIRPNVKYKWSDIYESEDALVAELVHIDAEIGEDVINPVAPFYKGYEFIHSFAKQLQRGKDLSDKQMIQAKRLAKEIKKASIVMAHVKKHNKLDPSKLTNLEIQSRYRYLKSSINHYIQQIENYKQQQDARERNKSINKEILELKEVLKKRSNGLCRLVGKSVDIGNKYVHVIRKTTKDDEILFMFPNALDTCKEIIEDEVYLMPRNNGKIEWIPVELEGMEYMYYIFEPEVISIIVKGWWFKFDEHKVTCKVYDGDMFIGEINNLNEEQVLNIRRFCEFKKRRCDF